MNPIDQFVQRNRYPCWCGEAAGSLYCSQSFGRRPFAVLRCPSCGTLRILPKALSESADAVELYNTYAAPRLSPEQVERIAARELARFLKVGCDPRPGMRVLDVGCGEGLLLEEVCRDFRCEGRGIDVDQRRIAAARECRTHAQFECGLFEPGAITERFDLVISQAVIEHVVDPVGFLVGLASVLAPGGALYVLTPNGASRTFSILRSWWRDLLSIDEHIYLFTPESLARCAGQAGLEVAASDSGHDLAWPTIALGSPREVLITGWALYRELVKRACALVGGSARGDILFARLVVKPAAQSAVASTPA